MAPWLEEQQLAPPRRKKTQTPEKRRALAEARRTADKAPCSLYRHPRSFRTSRKRTLRRTGRCRVAAVRVSAPLVSRVSKFPELTQHRQRMLAVFERQPNRLPQPL